MGNNKLKAAIVAMFTGIVIWFSDYIITMLNTAVATDGNFTTFPQCKVDYKTDSNNTNATKAIIDLNSTNATKKPAVEKEKE
jgi:hypothetical protein